MALNARRSLDPRWLTHHRRVVKGFMLREVVIFALSTDAPAARWDPLTNTLVGGDRQLLWEGQARIQGNKDWRARSITSASDPQMVQYVRVQIPFGPDNPVPHIPVDAVVEVQPVDPDSTWVHDDDIMAWTLRVRNSVNSSNPWVRNLLCGTDVSEAPVR